MTHTSDHIAAAVSALPPLEPDDALGIQLRLHLGQCLRALGDTDGALALADDVLHLHPSHRGARLLEIDAAIDSGDVSRALRAMDAGRAHFRNEADYLRRKLRALRRGARTTEIAPLLEALHRIEPRNADILVELGRTHVAHGSPGDAQEAFQRALEIDPDNTDAWQGLVEAAKKHAEPIAACAIAEQALARFPGKPALVDQAARAMIAIGRVQDAQTLLEEALANAAGDTARLRLVLALAHRKSGDFAASETLHADLVAQDPGRVAVWTSWTQTALEQGDIDHALELSARALSHCPDATPLKRQRAEVLRRAGRIDEAIAALEVLHNAAPGDLRVARTLAETLRAAGRLDDADRLYTGILRIDPGHWPALEGRVSLAEGRGDLETAMALLEDGSMTEKADDTALT